MERNSEVPLSKEPAFLYSKCGRLSINDYNMGREHKDIQTECNIFMLILVTGCLHAVSTFTAS